MLNQELVHEDEGGAQKMTIRANKVRLAKGLREVFGETSEALTWPATV